MKRNHKISLFEIDESTVRVEIESESGDLDRLEIGGLPRKSEHRRAVIDASLNHFLAEQAFRYQRDDLTARVVKNSGESGN